ncbi:LamG-like jellyroll fold domain-containing protein [Paradesertivirga mongoliensis]|uniref:LamG-like jellyroll fold domain-containing protein n=1 Tax=Paradesertivirga mongoliensis TaxID=2100740 RepID=A0ABW4ZIV4_9SPHI|nr:LamG-like jellyroll fold domain-containing protein [Pedobacter mongoliensis]
MKTKNIFRFLTVMLLMLTGTGFVQKALAQSTIIINNLTGGNSQHTSCIGTTWSKHEWNIIFPASYRGNTIRNAVLYYRRGTNDNTTIVNGAFTSGDNGAFLVNAVTATGLTNFTPAGTTQTGSYYKFDFTGQTLSIPADGILWFRFNATTGSCSQYRNDIGGSLYTSTYQQSDNIRSGFTSFLIEGDNGGALNFDGQNDYVAVNNPFTAFGKELTVEWTANIDASSVMGSGISQSTANVDNMASDVWMMHYNGDGTMNFYVNDNGSWKTAGANVPAGWHKWTGVANAYSINLYMDGNLVATTPNGITSGIKNNANSVIHLGKDSRWTSRFMKGGIDEVRIWSRALCAGEILNNLNGELSGTQTGLQEYYKFNHGAAQGNNAGITSLTDFSGNNRNGALINFALTGTTSNWIAGAISGSAPVFAAPSITASNNGPVTAGSAINLAATGTGTFAWTGPNGFTSALQNPSISNASSANAGTYTVTINQNGCTNTASTNVVVLSTPARALSFGGSNDYVNLGSLLPSNASFTKEAWILSTDANSANNIFSTNADPIWIPNGTLSVGQAGNYQVITDTNPFALNTWTHVAVAYDQPAKTLKLYVNGILKASTLNAPAYAGGTIFLGHHAGGSGNSSIKMDEVRFWNRALCQGEIQSNMNAELNPASQSGLIALYHANQGFVSANNSAETTLSDASGNNKNGTLANFALTGSSSNWTEGPVTGTAPAFVPPTASFTANGPLAFCPSGSVTFTADPGSGFTYQWTKNGLPIEGANAVSYNANASGSYNVIITQNGCTASAEALQVVVEDLVAPTVSKLQDAIIDLDNNCSFIMPDYRSQLSIGDNCTPITSLIVTQTPSPGTELTGAESISVSFSVKDLSGNDTTSSFTLVKRDVTAPTVAAKNYTLYLGANGAGTLTTSDVNNNSFDGCGPVALSFSNAGKICAIANENGTLSLTAPQGAVFTSIDFASYGNATGSCGNFVQGWCNSSLSQSRVEAAFLGKNSGSIVANNGNFGDPCYGTVKRLVVQASYSIPGVSANGESVSFTCNQVGNNTVTLIGSDGSGNVANATAIVTVIDSVKPKALAQNIIVQLDASGHAFTTAEAVNNGSTDACGIASVTLSKTAFDCSNVGENTVVLTVTDVNGNVSTANATITVEDKVAPAAMAQNVTIHLDASGNASTTAEAVNNGSADACGIESITLSKTAFDCSNVGENTTVLTVTDVNGNVSTVNAIVTVLDNIAPAALAQNVTVQLNAFGNASTTAALVNNGSADACGIKSITLSKTDFDCSNVGENTVVLTVTDVNGNVSTANAIVTVQDNIAPAIITRNVVVQLNANGQGSITEPQIDNGSSDNCSIASYSLDKRSFDCSNVGPNTVVLTVTDINGNVSTANATVTVEDNIAPLALAKNIQVTLVNGAASITAALIDNGSNDACGIQSLAIDKSSFDCSNLGQNTVVLTVTDKNYNVSTTTAVVNVIGVTPVASIAVSRSNNTFTGLDSKTIALGYGAQSLTLTASNSTSASNATTYAWHPSAGLSSANVANPVFTPTAAGTYTFNVIATNEFGCTASSTVTITVLDVRCGSKNEKVLVCQKTGSGSNPWVQICISPNAVDAHLKKGSTLGTCGTTSSTTLASSPENETLTLSNSLNVSSKNSLTVYPNPFVSETTVSFTLISDAVKVSLDLYDLKGVRISNIYSGNAEAFRNYSFRFDGKSVPAGVYFFRLSGSGNALNFKVIVSQ